MKNILCFYGSHNSSATFVDKNDRVRVIELERHTKKRHAAFAKGLEDRLFGITDEQRKNFLEYISNTIHDPEKIDQIMFQELTRSDGNLISKYFPNAKFFGMNHHPAHAFCGQFQSGFDASIIFSIDGGGIDDGKTLYTKTFLADGHEMMELGTSDVNYGGSYQVIGKYISEIKKKYNDASHGDELSWAGKIMGLCAYGKVREEWVDCITEYYLTDKRTRIRGEVTDQPTPDGLWTCLVDVIFKKMYNEKLFPEKEKRLCPTDEPNSPLWGPEENCLSEQESYDLAATSQFVFEKCLFEMMKPVIDEHPERDVILVGGCALNVLYNQKLYEYISENFPGRKLYIPPNPDDGGLSLGYFFSHEDCTGLRGKDFVYEGIELLDRDDLQSHVKERNAKEVTTEEIVDIIKRGEIVGLVYGDSEIGPRALGNRSIICDPSFENMKDILNKKVKFREWYRPFAPVCLLEDADTYFHNVFESNYMSFAPKVKEEYHEQLKSITHVDGTSRLQTVSENGHKVFTDILNELKNRDEIPVILNTSFNIRGFPILTTIEDALHVLDNTELDHVVVEGYIFSK